MPQPRTKRRKVTPEMYETIAEQAAAGASARMILDKLGPSVEISERTVQDVMTEVTRKPGDPWTLAVGSDPEDNRQILGTLREVIKRTDGAVHSFTLAEAEWVAVLRRSADLGAWEAYVYALRYVAMGGMSTAIDLNVATFADAVARSVVRKRFGERLPRPPRTSGAPSGASGGDDEQA